MFSKLQASRLATALALSAAGHPPMPATSRRAGRAPPARSRSRHLSDGQVSYRSISSTDEARALAGTIVQDPSARPAIPPRSCTDEARLRRSRDRASVTVALKVCVLAGIPGHHSPHLCKTRNRRPSGRRFEGAEPEFRCRQTSPCFTQYRCPRE